MYDVAAMHLNFAVPQGIPPVTESSLKVDALGAFVPTCGLSVTIRLMQLICVRIAQTHADCMHVKVQVFPTP